MVAEFMHSVTQSLWTPIPTPCPLLASHTLSPSLSLPLPHSVLSPLLLICLNLSVEPPPSSPHHLSLTTSLSFSTPPTPPHAVSVLLPVSQQQLHTRQSSVSAFTNTPRKTHSYTRTLADTHTHMRASANTSTLSRRVQFLIEGCYWQACESASLCGSEIDGKRIDMLYSFHVQNDCSSQTMHNRATAQTGK